MLRNIKLKLLFRITIDLNGLNSMCDNLFVIIRKIKSYSLLYCCNMYISLYNLYFITFPILCLFAIKHLYVCHKLYFWITCCGSLWHCRHQEGPTMLLLLWHILIFFLVCFVLFLFLLKPALFCYIYCWLVCKLGVYLPWKW